MNRPISVWLMMAYFALVSLDKALTLFAHKNDAEYSLFRDVGLDAIFFVLAAAIALLSAAAVRALWAPGPSTIRVGLAAIVAYVVYELAGAAVAVSHPDAFRAALVARLAARGQTENSEALLAVATSPTTLAAGLGATIAFAAFLAWVLVRNRRYFEGTCAGRAA
jgi:hypothetical protein